MIPHPYLVGAGVLGLGAWLLLKPKKAPAPPWTPTEVYTPPADPFAFQPEADPAYAPYFPTDPKYGPYVHEDHNPSTGPAYSAPPVMDVDDYGWNSGDDWDPAWGEWDENGLVSGRRRGVDLLAKAKKAMGL